MNKPTQAQIDDMVGITDIAVRLEVKPATVNSWIARDQLPVRPNRVEPRRVKRRPKPYSLLVKPRHWYRNHPDPRAR